MSQIPPTLTHAEPAFPHDQQPHQSGTFVKLDELTLTYHNYTTSIICPWCCTFYLF